MRRVCLAARERARAERTEKLGGDGRVGADGWEVVVEGVAVTLAACSTDSADIAADGGMTQGGVKGWRGEGSE